MVQRCCGRARSYEILKLYLASASPRRAKLLKEAAIKFQILKTGYHETHPRGMKPSRVVQKNALGKALSALNKIKSGVILSADTIVYSRGQVIGKPKNLRDAEKILFSLQGRWQTVYTGVALLSVRRGIKEKKILFHEKTRVKLKKMTLSEIQRYFKRVNPMDKAGAYAIQTRTNSLAEETRGSFSNAVGLPMEKLKKTLNMLK